MKAMLLRQIAPLTQNPTPLSFEDIPEPQVGAGEVLIRVTRCGVCHTELDEIEGRTPPPHLPVVLGHQVVGEVVALGSGVKPELAALLGQRVGVGWIFSACGECEYCLSGQENLCPHFRATGRDSHGGYAQFMVAPADFIHPIPAGLSDSEAAPLLCAGAIGYRSLKLCQLQDGQTLGLMGFGGSNHLVLKMARYQYPHSPIFVFSRNPAEREFARSLGATWAGAIDEIPPTGVDAIIDTTPVWGPDLEALKRLKPGGRLVINAIRKEASDQSLLATLDYPSQLWLEKEVKSVANVTRADVRECLALATEAGIRPEFQEYELGEANRALLELKQGKIRGAKVLHIQD